uniref:Uncharacterized protein n=1 Tax=Acrobeloides nanus TaxID=290746 RepID=A0A914CBU8_9BILA
MAPSDLHFSSTHSCRRGCRTRRSAVHPHEVQIRSWFPSSATGLLMTTASDGLKLPVQARLTDHRINSSSRGQPSLKPWHGNELGSKTMRPSTSIPPTPFMPSSSVDFARCPSSRACRRIGVFLVSKV